METKMKRKSRQGLLLIIIGTLLAAAGTFLLYSTPEGFDYILPAPEFSEEDPVQNELDKLENILEVPWTAALRQQHATISQSTTGKDSATATLYAVSEGYFDLVHETLSEGRLLNRNDMTGGTVRALINQKGAERLFTGGDALGKTIVVESLSLEIAGILKGGLKAGESDEILVWLPITAADTGALHFQTMEIKTRVTGKEQKALTAAVLKNRNAGGTLQDGGRMRIAAMMPLWLIACITGVFLLRFGFRKLRFLAKHLRARIREELQGQYASKVSLRAMPHILLFVLLCAIWLCAGWLLLRLIVMPFYTFTDWIPESPADPASILSCIRNLMITAASSAVYKSRAASATETASALIRAGCFVCMIGLVPFRRSVRPPE